MPFLRHAEIRSIQHAVFVLAREAVPRAFELRDQAFEDACMPSPRHPWHVLHHEVARLEFSDQLEEVEHKTIAVVVYQALPDEREPLAGGPACDEIQFAVPL